MDDNSKVSCPLCMHSIESEAWSLHGQSYFQCIDCSLIFLRPKERLSLEEETRRYENHQNDSKDLKYRSFLKPMMDLILENCSPGNSGLDYGCGPGPTLSIMLQEKGFSMSNYDPIFEIKPEVLQQKYDFITCTEAIEHFFDPKKEIEKINALLKPNGKLGLMTLRFESRKAFEQSHYHRDPTHVCFYSQKTFTWIANAMKWKVSFPSSSLVMFCS